MRSCVQRRSVLYTKAHGVKRLRKRKKPIADSFRVGEPVKTEKSAPGIYFTANTRGCETGVFAKNHSRKLSFTPQKQNGVWLT